MSGAAVTPADAMTRELITPEGVDLRIVLASASERASAFMLDAAIIVGVLFVFTIVCIVALAGAGPVAGQAAGIIWLLGFFVLRNAWFMAFELGPRAATPGKRRFGLQVAARDGGRLTADAIFARNAMREIEVYLPLTFLLVNAIGVDGWIVLFGLAWSGVFAFFPLFNRDHLRVGDLVAGTWVVKRPRRRLVVDLSDAPVRSQRFDFSAEQLDAYGVKELQVLEEVLRANLPPTLRAVAERIRRKIGRDVHPEEGDREFLSAYYGALRARLEARLLIGRRRRDKFDRG